MFHLFGKKAAVLERRLAEYQRKQDWAGLAKACYQLGAEAMDKGNPNRALLWLGRADTIYSADNAVFEQVTEKLMDDCSDRLGHLEGEHILYNDVPAKVGEMAEALGDVKVRVWGLLSLARLVKLGEKLSALPGCEMFGKLGWAVDTVLKSLQEPLEEYEFEEMQELCSALYEFGDSPDFWGLGSEIIVPGGAPFQVFDLNGMKGVHLELEAYLDGHLEMVCAREQGEELPEPATGIIIGALLPDYYVRAGAGRLEEVPQIKEELERIWSDYEFVCSDITWELTAQRIEAYRELDVLR
ncbi:MAG TPA: hypothetical protein DCZ91_03900 [Lachnospiraceae bacterium]|nr:hypothetical protein [Lachnospiraceae bacterium]